jgi:serine protein kinase
MPTAFMDDISSLYQESYKKRNVLLTFDEFLDHLRQNPRQHLRFSAQYLLDAFAYFGSRDSDHFDLLKEKRFRMFDGVGENPDKKVIGGEMGQRDLVHILESFVRSGQSNKLILLHGPNGSSKSSTIDAIASGLQAYSHTQEGCVYRFHWIFPMDKHVPASNRWNPYSGSIGFVSDKEDLGGAHYPSYALLDEAKIASKISSDFKENPIFLIPMPYRETALRQWVSQKEGVKPEDVTLPQAVLGSGLSKRNQQIFECLLQAYHGNLKRVLAHVQVERFFYSKQYRVGISTVEPQMSIDAAEKQLTMDKNYANIPPILHTINFYQAQGPLVEANRGILEFSDLLKRPVETFKYLLSSIEKSGVNLPSGTVNLDLIYLATTNEKHLDAFKTIPDFSSFKGRFELIKVPYLLLPKEEEKIYAPDLRSFQNYKPVAPHSLSLLCTWACLTRLKQPDPENFPPEYRPLILRLEPKHKLLLYQGLSLEPDFTPSEQYMLAEIRLLIWGESLGVSIYEGRFGASPREIRAVLHRAVQNNSTLTPLHICEELRHMTRDRSVYDFLQFEPRGKYHDASYFIDMLEEDFLRTFEQEAMESMSMAEDKEYDLLLKRYVDHVVCEIKKEQFFDETTHSLIPPSQTIMSDMEGILGVSGSKDDHRMGLLSRIAAFRIENPDKTIHISELFQDFLRKIKAHYYKEKSKLIEANIKTMVALHKKMPLSPGEEAFARRTYGRLESLYGYDRESAFHCLKALLMKK